VTTASFHILYNSSLAYHTFIRRYIVRVNEKASLNKLQTKPIGFSTKILIYLFIVYLTTLCSNADYTAPNEKVKVNDELERIWKEAMVVYLKEIIPAF
jgi:hypothetical protein